jgi:hypothetical protein
MHFCMYLLYNFCTNLHVSNDHFVHHQEFMIYCILQLCTNRANVSADTCARFVFLALLHHETATLLAVVCL